MGNHALVAPLHDLFTTLRVYICDHGSSYEHQPPCADYTGRAVEWASIGEHGMFFLPIIIDLYSEKMEDNWRTDAFALISRALACHKIFKGYAIQTISAALLFTQDLKLGHYIKVPPRASFIVQSVATLLAGILQVGIKEMLFTTVKDICAERQNDKLTCPHNRVFFSASAIWYVLCSPLFLLETTNCRWMS